MSGELIANRYQLGDRLGVGGMSTVRLAYDRRLERSVAVKLLAEHLADDPTFVSRFRREALAAARLVHPNIVQVFDFGLDEDSDRHYIVMEFVEGQSGAQLLRDHGALPVSEVLAIVGHSCRGLEFAHRNGVVHRDIKPGNLLRSTEQTTKVADFGIAKTLADESSITQAGSVLGTAAYLAPEQAAGQEAGPQADLYGLGVVAYQLLSGQLPYEAQSLTELAIKQQREAPPLLDEIVEGVSPQLALAVDRALALDPNDRFPDAAAMRRAIVDGARETEGTTRATRVAPAPEPATSATRVVGRTDPATTRQPAPVAARQPSPPRAGRRGGAVTPPPGPPPPPAGKKRRRMRGWLTVFAVLLLVSAGIAIAVVATSTDKTAVNLREITSHKAQGIIDQLKQLVDDNTK